MLLLKIMTTAQQIYDAVLQYFWPFLAVFFLMFTITYAFLVVIDFVPEAPSTEVDDQAAFVERAIAANNGGAEETVSTTEAEASFDPFTAVTIDSTVSATDSVSITETVATNPVSVVSTTGEEAVSLAIPSLSRTVSVVIPASSSLADLDTALLSGVARHPDSVQLGEEGNVVILGHSSYLPTVFNRNFQALNGTQNLEWGDTIIVESDTTRYTYLVKDVYQVKASEAVIPIAVSGQRLTLVTCNSFATDDDRFIIEAELLTSEPLS